MRSVPQRGCDCRRLSDRAAAPVALAVATRPAPVACRRRRRLMLRGDSRLSVTWVDGVLLSRRICLTDTKDRYRFSDRPEQLINSGSQAGRGLPTGGTVTVSRQSPRRLSPQQTKRRPRGWKHRCGWLSSSLSDEATVMMIVTVVPLMDHIPTPATTGAYLADSIAVESG